MSIFVHSELCSDASPLLGRRTAEEEKYRRKYMLCARKRETEEFAIPGKLQ